MKLKGLMCVMGALLVCAGSASAADTSAVGGADVVSGSYTITVKRPDGTKSTMNLATSSGTAPAMAWIGDPVQMSNGWPNEVGSCTSKDLAPTPSGGMSQVGSTTTTFKQGVNSGLSVSVVAAAGGPGNIDTVLVVSDTHANYQGPTPIGGCTVAQGSSEAFSLTKAVHLKEGATAFWEFGSGRRVTIKLDHVDYLHQTVAAVAGVQPELPVIDRVPQKIGDTCKVEGERAVMPGDVQVHCGADLHWAKDVLPH
jgi:hypothetical protein